MATLAYQLNSIFVLVLCPLFILCRLNFIKFYSDSQRRRNRKKIIKITIVLRANQDKGVEPISFVRTGGRRFTFLTIAAPRKIKCLKAPDNAFPNIFSVFVAFPYLLGGLL